MRARMFKTISALCAAAFLLTGCNYRADPQLEVLAEDREVSLSLHIVDHSNDNANAMKIAIERNRIPPGVKLVPYRGGENEPYLLILKRTQLDQDCITRASASHTPHTKLPILNFKFDEQCAAIFSKTTAKNIGRRFAVVLDDVAIAAPIIQTAIDNGAVYIELGFESIEDVEALAKSINNKNN